MSRPPLSIGTWGSISTKVTKTDKNGKPVKHQSQAKFRDHDGHVRNVTATGRTKTAAEQTLLKKLQDGRDRRRVPVRGRSGGDAGGSVGDVGRLCLARTATGKQAWLEQLGVETVWPMSGKPHELYVDNAAEFKSEALRRGCEQHGIALAYRPPGLPHFGGIAERVIGTMMSLVHDELPGTTFSNVTQRGQYDSDGNAVVTLAELNAWLVLAVACYHGEVHDGLGRPPAAVWAELAERDGTRSGRADLQAGAGRVGA